MKTHEEASAMHLRAGEEAEHAAESEPHKREDEAVGSGGGEGGEAKGAC